MYNSHVRALCVACAVGGAAVQFTRTCSVRCLRCGWGCCTIHRYRMARSVCRLGVVPPQAGVVTELKLEYCPGTGSV